MECLVHGKVVARKVVVEKAHPAAFCMAGLTFFSTSLQKCTTQLADETAEEYKWLLSMEVRGTYYMVVDARKAEFQPYCMEVLDGLIPPGRGRGILRMKAFCSFDCRMVASHMKPFWKPGLFMQSLPSG